MERQERRDRPKKIVQVDSPRQFTRNYINGDGSTETWKFDLDIFLNGPIETKITSFPKKPKNVKRGESSGDRGQKFQQLRINGIDSFPSETGNSPHS